MRAARRARRRAVPDRQAVHARGLRRGARPGAEGLSDDGESYLPAPKEIRDLLADLLGREVAVTPERAAGADPEEPVHRRGVRRRHPAGDGPSSPATSPSPPTPARRSGWCPVGRREAARRGGRARRGPARATSTRCSTSPRRCSTSTAPTTCGSTTCTTSARRCPPTCWPQSLTLGRREDLAVEVAGYGSGKLVVRPGAAEPGPPSRFGHEPGTFLPQPARPTGRTATRARNARPRRRTGAHPP